MPTQTEIEKVQAENLKSFETWLKKHSKALAPKTNSGVIYSGLKAVEKLRPSGLIIGGSIKKGSMPEMWKFIKAWNEMHKQICGKLRYETVEDVLKNLPPARIKWTQGRSHNIFNFGLKNMYDCAEELSSDKEQMLSKKRRDEVWKKLSQIYASNIKGELAIMEGIEKDFKRLAETRIMISTEIPELIENHDLDAKSKKELLKLAASYNITSTKEKNLNSEIEKTHKALKKQL